MSFVDAPACLPADELISIPTSETPEGVVGGIDSCSLLLLRSIGEA